MLSTSYSSEEIENSSGLGNMKIRLTGVKKKKKKAGIRLVLNSTRYLTTRVKKRLRKHWERSSLHAEDPDAPHTCKRFPRKKKKGEQ